MATITIRDLDHDVKERLRLRAAQHGRSMEEEARVILRVAVAQDARAQGRLAESIQRRFKSLGGINLELPEREAIRGPARPK